jgi:hypothetical protein
MSVAYSLLAVANDDEVRDAARDGVEMCLGSRSLARRHLQHHLYLFQLRLGEVLAVVELNAVCALRLEGWEEGLRFRFMYWRGVARSRISPVGQCVYKEEQEQRWEKKSPWPATKAATQQFEHGVGCD